MKRNPMPTQDGSALPTRPAVRTPFGCVIALIILAVVVGTGLWMYFAHERSEKEKSQRQQAEHRAKQEAIWESITGMAKRHNAITDWRKRFLTKEKPEEAIYSAELSAALINSEHRPALFIVQVQDVVQADGNWKIFLVDTIGVYHDAVLSLSCSSEQANLILSSPRGKDDQFAVIASISSVDSNQEMIILHPDTSSQNQPMFFLKGQLLDLQFLGSDYDEIESFLSQ